MDSPLEVEDAIADSAERLEGVITFAPIIALDEEVDDDDDNDGDVDGEVVDSSRLLIQSCIDNNPFTFKHSPNIFLSLKVKSRTCVVILLGDRRQAVRVAQCKHHAASIESPFPEILPFCTGILLEKKGNGDVAVAIVLQV